MLKDRRDRLTLERASLPMGEKTKPPHDILGALVASQMEVENEAKLDKGEVKIAGLTDKEILGNTCESSLTKYKADIRDLYRVSF